MKKIKSIEEMEREEISRLERQERKNIALESAREKVRLGLKYGEPNFENITLSKLEQLRKKERKDKFKEKLKTGTISFLKSTIKKKDMNKSSKKDLGGKSIRFI